MKRQLSKNQREEIEKAFGNLLLYQAIKCPCWNFTQQYLPHLKLQSEDVLCEYFNIIDWIREEADNNIELKIESLWGRLYEDIEAISGNNVTQTEKEFAVAEILSVVLVSIQTINDSVLLNSLSLRLSILINERAEQYWNELQNTFIYNFQKWGFDKLAIELKNYLSSEHCYSDKIEDICTTEIVETTNTNTSPNKLTTKQVAILLIELLDKPIEAINATALGDLINALTGGTRGRVVLEELKNNKQGYNPKDALHIAELLEKIDINLAQKIKNGVID